MQMRPKGERRRQGNDASADAEPEDRVATPAASVSRRGTNVPGRRMAPTWEKEAQKNVVITNRLSVDNWLRAGAD